MLRSPPHMVGLEQPEPDACGHRVRPVDALHCRAVVDEAGSSVTCCRVVYGYIS